MKILHTVENYFPSIGGMQTVVQKLSEYLVEFGHEVTVAAAYRPDRTEDILNGVRIKSFQISGNDVTGMRGDVQAYQDFLLGSDFDVVTNFASQQWATDCMLPLLNQIRGKKVFVPTGFSKLKHPAYQAYFHKMATWLNEYDLNVFTSEKYQDFEFARSLGMQNLTVIYNGADEREFSESPKINIRKMLGIRDKAPFILNVSSHTGLKGHSEAIRIFHRAKCKNATLLIIGNHENSGCYKSCMKKQRIVNHLPIRLIDRKKVLIEELTREQTLAAYHAADCFLFTSRIECAPLVLFECMASRTPFLTTDVGNAAEIVELSQSGVLLPTLKFENGHSRADEKQSARLLSELCRDKQRMKEYSETGYGIWKERFTWEKIAREYEARYLDLLT